MFLCPVNVSKLLLTKYMSKKAKVSYLFIFAIIFICSYFCIHFFTKKAIDINTAPTKVEINSNFLVTNFLTNEKKADKIYTNKVIEIVGKVEEVSFLNNRNTLILQSEQKGFGIICDMNPGQLAAIMKIKKGDEVRIKGVCKGFLKDVIVLNCILIDQKLNE